MKDVNKSDKVFSLSELLLSNMCRTDANSEFFLSDEHKILLIHLPTQYSLLFILITVLDELNK